MRPVRVVMVAHRAQPEIGGVETVVAETARRLAAQGYDLELLTTDRTGALPSLERGDGYLVRRFRAYPAGRDWYLSPGLFWALLRGRWDLLHIQGVHTLVPPLAMLAAILKRLPYTLTFHTGGSSSELRERARSTQWRVLTPLLRRARRLVGVSVFEARRFEAVLDVPEGTIRVVRNGGSLPAPSDPVAVEPGLIVSSGRLERYKGHHRAIEALPVLARTRPEVHLRILGSGPYEADLVALAQRLGVADRVQIEFIPPPERERMARSLAAAEVVVLLSDYEAHPVAVMEALTAGKASVISRTSGLTEIAEVGWAVGVPQDATPEQVAAAIESQLEHPIMVDRALLPTWETCATGHAEVYEEIRKETRSNP